MKSKNQGRGDGGGGREEEEENTLIVFITEEWLIYEELRIRLMLDFCTIPLNVKHLKY